MKTGGVARYFAEVNNIEELNQIRELSLKENLPIFIIAAGSNVVASSEDFQGIVMKVSFEESELDGKILRSGAGVQMSELVTLSTQAGLAGLEWAGGLPGTFGGAIRGNAGAFRGEIKDSIQFVTAYSLESGKTEIFSNEQCEFKYRDSFFKQNPSWVIISAELLLSPGNAEELQKVAQDHIEFRKNRHPLEFPNAGSMFKNTPVDKLSEAAKEHFKDFIKIDPFPVVPTGKIIQDAGLKGVKVGSAQVSEKHCNYLVNIGGATGEDVQALVEHIKNTVQEKFGIELETEPEFFGFNT